MVKSSTKARFLVLCILCASLLATLGCTGGDEEPAAVSETRARIDPAVRRQPSYHLFSAWLDAFNSGDRARYGRFLEQKFPSRTAYLDEELGFRESTGGFDLRKVALASPVEIRGWVQERDSDQFAEFDLSLAPYVPPVKVTAAGPQYTITAAKPHTIVSLSLLAIPRPPEFPVARLSEGELLAGVGDLAEKHSAAGHFSGAVLVARHGDVLFSEAYGLADRGRRVPNTPQTRFRIGSMNKMFTAVAILQLIEDGRVELAAPLGRYLRDYQNKDLAKRVTIHNLLTHTGGTGDIFGPEFDAHRTALRTHADYVELYGRDRIPSMEPGSRFEYSNYGFILLGRVIEAVTGRSYYDYVKANVFDPAGMTGTGSLPERVTVPGRAVGYTRPPASAEWAPNDDTLPYRGTAAGGGYSTVEDLARFADALLGHELLSPEATELLVTGKVDSWPGTQYAYGFEDARDVEGNGSVGHGGGAPGMNGDLRIYPKSGYVIAVLANMDPPAAQRISDYLTLRLPTEG